MRTDMDESRLTRRFAPQAKPVYPGVYQIDLGGNR